MAFRYCNDVLLMLKKAGYNTNRLRKENLLSQSTIQKLRTNQMVSLSQIDVICGLVGCVPSDFVQYVATQKGGEED